MNRFGYTGVLVLLCLCLVADRCFGWGSTPIAAISDCPKFEPLKAFENEEDLWFSALEGSYDPDNGEPYGWGNGIVEYQWVWPPQAYDPDYSEDHSAFRCKFNANGKFKVRVRVKDDDGVWSAPEDDLEKWATCIVYVFTMDLDISGVSDAEEENPGAYIPENDDDDNSNSTPDKDESGTVSGEDDLVQISLSYQPSTLDVGYAELKIPYSNDHIRVWSNSTKATMVVPDGSDYYKRWPIGSMPSTLWVEGYYAGPGWLWLHFTPDGQAYPGGTYNHDPVKFTVVSVEISKCSSSWLPKKQGDSGYKTDITATVDPSLTGVSKTYQFVLDPVSARPGYCTNMGTQTDNDLQFEDQSGYTISGSSNEIATKTSTTGSETLSVSSFDYGAYGKIKCKVQIAGKTFLAHIPFAPLQRFARIPRDDNENNIADAWADNSGRATDDNDNTPGGANDGDGLSRYEEYRGFVIGGSHTRTDANDKDIFIYDEDSLGFGYAGGLGFTFRSINNNEWTGTSSRKINPKEDNDQCAIWLEDGGQSADGRYGDAYLGTPNGWDHAVIYVTTITNDGGNQSHIDCVIAHEIGHDVNITGDHDPAVGCIMDAFLDVSKAPPTSYCATCLGQRQLH